MQAETAGAKICLAPPRPLSRAGFFLDHAKVVDSCFVAVVRATVESRACHAQKATQLKARDPEIPSARRREVKRNSQQHIMTDVIQSLPHEIARQEKLAHLAAVDAREELQRRHAQNAADKDSDAERQARLAPVWNSQISGASRYPHRRGRLRRGAAGEPPRQGHQRRRARAEGDDAAGESPRRRRARPTHR